MEGFAQPRVTDWRPPSDPFTATLRPPSCETSRCFTSSSPARPEGVSVHAGSVWDLMILGESEGDGMGTGRLSVPARTTTTACVGGLGLKVSHLLPRSKPHVVLLAPQMTPHDGLAVLAPVGMFAAGGHLPLMVLTEDSDTASRNRALAADVNRNQEQPALTRALLTFASEVGAHVIAKGIEEPAELRTLQDLGVPSGQGCQNGRPATSEMARA